MDQTQEKDYGTHEKGGLVVRDLSMRFGDKLALKNLSFEIDKGEIFCLLGQNGAGKTTTINILLGLLQPSSGEVWINSTSLLTDPTATNALAYIPEVVQLYGKLTGAENLDFFSRLAEKKYSKSQLEEYLSRANLQKEAFHKKLSTYSKGMRQKVGIAIALAKKASFILMDEPTSGLDPKASEEFVQICKELSQNNVGIVMATHDIFNAVKVGTRIGIMKEGSLVYTTASSNISAQELQELYIKTI